MRYENLLSRSAKIVWRHPWLCLLALLAGETAGGGGGGGGGGNSPTFQGRFTSSAGPQSVPDFGWVPQWISDRASLILAIALVVAVVGILWFLVSCLTAGALIRSVDEFDAGGRPTFGRAWRLGAESYWRVFAFKLVQFLLVLVPALSLVVAPLLGLAAGGGQGLIRGLLLDLPLLVTYLFWTAFVSALSLLGIRSCVLDGTGPVSSFGAAFRLLRAHFPKVALTAVVFGLVGLGIGIVLQLVVGLASAPFLFSFGDTFANGRWSELPGKALLALAVLVPVSLVLSSIVGGYYSTAWTLAYRRFAVEGVLPEPAPLA